MKKILVFILLVFTIFLFSTTIDYVLIVPSDILVSEITSLIDNLESYDFKISLTDYGLSKKIMNIFIRLTMSILKIIF